MIEEKVSITQKAQNQTNSLALMKDGIRHRKADVSSAITTL